MSLSASSKVALLGCLVVFAFFNSACVSQTVIYENNFDDDPTGQYSIENLNADWNTPPFDNGVEEGRVSIDDSSEAFAGKSLAVEYPAGMHRSANTGAQWQLHFDADYQDCLLYTSPSPRDATLSRMPSSA